ncbi:sensor histidine kinase [Streptomyces sp. NPDC004609]|uniref:sensor histidine kinase n=1 Tax=Streptomyces sp. NPDC004609 TaxID=3364704 RepID=UPI0036C015BE
MTVDGQPDKRLMARDAIAVAGYLAVIALTGPAGGVRETAAPAWLLMAMLAVTVLPAVLRRLWPLPVFGGVLAATCAAVLLDAVHDPFVPASFALYTVAVEGRTDRWWRRWLPGLAILALGLCAMLAVGPVHPGRSFWWADGPGLILLGFGTLLGAWELGRAARERRAFAVRTGEQLAQRAVTEERLRIARELHDVVTHSMGLIVVKAGVANHVVRTRPGEIDVAHDALRVIEATGRGALTELRQMLGVLRSQSGERLPAALGPAPGARDLPGLARRAGAELRTGNLDRLPEGVGLTVYRIVQEALTNVLRHAGPGAASRVSVQDVDGEVWITVSDDGPPAPAGPEGHGIAGMRERVALYGGTFTAGPRGGRGFEVRATLPYAPGEVTAR